MTGLMCDFLSNEGLMPRKAIRTVVTVLKQSVSVIEAVEHLVIRLLGFAALIYELVRGFFHGK